ncbi:MAG: hypothetical protein ACOYN0_09735 [Phycisphaerales bacterium]
MDQFEMDHFERDHGERDQGGRRQIVRGSLTVIDGPEGAGKTITLVAIVESLMTGSNGSRSDIRLAIATTPRLAAALFLPDEPESASPHFIDVRTFDGLSVEQTIDRLSRLALLFGVTHLVAHPLDCMFGSNIRDAVHGLARLAWDSSLAVVAVIPSTGSGQPPRRPPGVALSGSRADEPRLQLDGSGMRAGSDRVWPSRRVAETFLEVQLETGEQPETEILWKARQEGIDPLELISAKRRLGVREVMRKTKACRHKAWKLGA